MLAAAPWFIATDRDEAGDRAAAGWPARARRVSPPEPYKDWTEARQGGVDLARWWRDILSGIEPPPLYTWDDLAAWRWGPARDDSTSGLVIDRANPGRMLADLPDDNPYARDERDAIEAEGASL
jgi:hypothetical protein